MQDENGRGRGGEGWARVKEIIELAKTEVISVTPEQRKRVLGRPRKEMAAWRRSHQASQARPATASSATARAPRFATKSERGQLTG